MQLQPELYWAHHDPPISFALPYLSVPRRSHLLGTVTMPTADYPLNYEENVFRDICD